jgi:hypothetical protein
MEIKTYPYQDGDKLIELVEKREYDGMELLAHELATLRAEDMATINDLRKELQDAVKRMEAVSIDDLWDCFDQHNQSLIFVRARLISAAKGES